MAKEVVKKTNKAELVIVIFNVGFEQTISDIAKELNIGGGTFVNAHGLSKFEAEKFFNIAIESEKSLCLMVVNSDKRNEVLQAIYEKAGIATEAQGIAFALPVSELSANLKDQIFNGKTYKEEKPEIKVTNTIEETTNSKEKDENIEK